MVWVPVGMPGAWMALAAKASVPFTVPVPPSVAPLATLTALPAAIEPLRVKIPALMAVAPE